MRIVPVGHSFHMQYTRSVLSYIRGLSSADTFKGVSFVFLSAVNVSKIISREKLSVHESRPGRLVYDTASLSVCSP